MQVHAFTFVAAEGVNQCIHRLITLAALNRVKSRLNQITQGVGNHARGAGELPADARAGVFAIEDAMHRHVDVVGFSGVRIGPDAGILHLLCCLSGEDALFGEHLQ